MNKSLGLLFALVSVVWMTATAISLSYNGWLSALFFVLCIATIGCGFVYKARLRRRNGA